MKKMFLALAVAGLASTMAFAQDDYDYGDDYGTESTSSDDGYTELGSSEAAPAEEAPAPASDVEYKSMDDESKKVSRNEGEGGSVFDKQLNVGWNAGIGLGGFFSTEVCNSSLSALGVNACDDYGGDLFGGSFEFGGSLMYHINNSFSVEASLNIDLRIYMAKLGQFYLNVYDDYGYYNSYYSEVTLDALTFGIRVPVLGRYNFTPTVYAEAGLGVEVNLGTNISFSDEDGEDVSGVSDEDMGDKVVYKYFHASSFVGSLIVGGGATLDIGKFYSDVGVRVIVDFLPYIKLDDMFINAGWDKSSAKSWQIQFYMNPWFK